jgi:4-alpha-glucanotransferase
MRKPDSKSACGPLQSSAQERASSNSRSQSYDAGAPCPIRFTRAICGDLEQAERREWWIANGLGGYASGAIAGSLTRRYHGLLIAPVGSPLGRRLILAKADATLIEGARS